MNNYQDLIDAFFAGMSAGQLPADLFAEDATAYTTTSGQMDKAKYVGAGGLLAAVFDGGLRYNIKGVMIGEGRAAVEASSSGTFRDGVAFANEYVFLFHFADGKISFVGEHFDPRPVQELLVPRLQAFLAQTKA